METKRTATFAGYKDLDVYKLSYRMALEIFEETSIVRTTKSVKRKA